MTATLQSTLLRRLVRLEYRGEYSRALDLVSAEWREPSFEPDVSGLDAGASAALLMRIGAILGRAGHAEMVEGSQERSKDLVMRARETFLALADESNIAECENYLALAYGRLREFREAEVWLDQAEERAVEATHSVRLGTHLVRGWLYMIWGRHEEQVDLAKHVERDFRSNGDPLLNGSFCSNVGLSLKDLGRIPEALEYLHLARSFHSVSKNRTYQATVENNLALIYMSQGRHDLAHDCVDAAIDLYKRLGDRAREASSLETKAQIYIAASRLEDGLRTADRSIKLLQRHRNLFYLTESLMTRAKVLVQLDNFADGILALMDAVNIARTQTGEGEARSLIRQFELVVERQKTKRREVPGSVASRELELVLPPSLANYADYRTLHLHHSYLNQLGIADGSTILVVAESPVPGDVAAVQEKATGEVSCGSFDAAFGIVCLNGEDDHPRLFDESEVTVLGKVVGVCRHQPSGKLVAEPLRAAY
jgi:tetratricopeptide (TPR) repeat protein